MNDSLQIRVLGELDVRRGDTPVTLPPSRKTRALLAYLVLGGRAYRREQLCGLFWDVADDPRAELRWSLSKLRAIVDAARIDAGRDEVVFRAHGAVVDALEVRRAMAGRPLEAIATDELERLERLYRGELLDGLDLPDFDVYQAWRVAQREEARITRAQLLVELVRRLRAEPARAVDHARTRVLIDPHDVDARAALIEVLGALGRRDEALAHYDSGKRHASEATASTTLDRLDRAWHDASVGPAPARGRAPASVALSSGTHRVSPVEAVPLIGRERELAKLDAALARVESTRRFAAIAITGTIGTGKSRLLDAWLPRTRATNATIAATTAFEADVGRPYGPWLDALAHLPPPADRKRPELAQLARTSTPERSVDAPAEREQLYEEVAAAIADAAATSTLVLAIDDAHWLDAGAAAVLVHVARRCDRLPVLAVLMARPGELEDNSELGRALRGLRQLGAVEDHELLPLDAAATASLVRVVRPDADVDAVFARSGGNPLFALELARGGERSDGPAPGSIATAIRDRVAALPHDAAQLLRWGAVVRRDFAAPELEQISGMAPELVVDALDVLSASALLVQGADARHAFAHELVRQVVYDGLSEARRRLMHRRIAESLAAAIERGDERVDIADVAHHAAAAHDAALAVRTCLVAARRSLRVFATTDAAALARRGLRHAEAMPDPERTRYALELFEVELAARRPPDGEPVAQQIERLAEHALDLGAYEHARLGYHLLAYVRWERGAWSDAQRHMRHARMISQRGPEPEQIVGLAEAARCLVLLEKDLPEAQALALEAAARGRIAGVEPPATYAALGMLHLHRGRLADARGALERALSLARVRRGRHDELQAVEQLVVLDLVCDDANAAHARATELAALAARFSAGSEQPFACGLVALAAIARGEDAHAALDAALDELVVVDAKQRLAYLASRAAWLDSERGALELAATRARRALEAAEPLERATELALARAVLVRTGAADADEHLAEIIRCWTDVAVPVRDQLRAVLGDRLPRTQAQEDS